MTEDDQLTVNQLIGRIYELEILINEIEDGEFDND